MIIGLLAAILAALRRLHYDFDEGADRAAADQGCDDDRREPAKEFVLPEPIDGTGESPQA